MGSIPAGSTKAAPLPSGRGAALVLHQGRACRAERGGSPDAEVPALMAFLPSGRGAALVLHQGRACRAERGGSSDAEGGARGEAEVFPPS